MNQSAARMRYIFLLFCAVCLLFTSCGSGRSNEGGLFQGEQSANGSTFTPEAVRNAKYSATVRILSVHTRYFLAEDRSDSTLLWQISYPLDASFREGDLVAIGYIELEETESFSSEAPYQEKYLKKQYTTAAYAVKAPQIGGINTGPLTVE